MIDNAIKDELKEIKEAILKAVDVNAIYLFGSYAYGEPDEKSDFDLYLVLPDTSKYKPIDAIIASSIAIDAVQKRPVDLLAQTQSRFDSLKTDTTLENMIFNKGILVYEQ